MPTLNHGVVMTGNYLSTFKMDLLIILDRIDDSENASCFQYFTNSQFDYICAGFKNKKVSVFGYQGKWKVIHVKID